MNALAELGAALQEGEAADPSQAQDTPKACYTDPALLALERERLFGTEWLCRGRAEELP